MKMLIKAAMLAAISTVAVTATVPAATAQSKKGVAVASLPRAIALTNAYKTALSQIQVTYKAQIDARDSRQKVLQAELQALAVAYEAEAKKPNATEASVRPSAEAFQKKQAAAQQEINQLSQQIDLAVAYVEDQITVKLDDAVKAAMEKKNVDLLLKPDSIIARNGTSDITQAVVDELNVSVPSAQIVPPADYQPGSLVQAQQRALIQAAQAQQSGAQPQSR
ncbi:OmpH family outer membrane protein [Sphingorhabdus arenilitoris]|uniref:OmpH family outer membrane protein n=1 Tax=Sphingorhabdus arenilitoris TaxID=1490041 RepID=A0ABV8RHY8_9SPHN